MIFPKRFLIDKNIDDKIKMLNNLIYTGNEKPEDFDYDTDENKNHNIAQHPTVSYKRGAPYYDVDFIGGFDIILNDQAIKPSTIIWFFIIAFMILFAGRKKRQGKLQDGTTKSLRS